MRHEGAIVPKKTFLSGAGRTLAAVAVASLAALGLAAPALAAGPSGPDPARNGSSSLTIEQQDSSTFQVYRVDIPGDPIDLTSNEGWQKVNDLYADLGGNPTQQDLLDRGLDLTAVPATTPQPNPLQVVFPDLTFGLYYVTETVPAAGYDPILPFLVTVPTTDQADGSTWVYDVVVSPKNRSTTDKTVEDGTASHGDLPGSPGSGSVLTWTIRGNVVDGIQDQYEVVDDLDGRLVYQTARVSLATGSPQTTIPLTEGLDADYTVATVGGGGSPTEVTVELRADGIRRLQRLDEATTQVVVEIDTTIAGGADGGVSGLIENDAIVIQNNGVTTEIPGTDTKWGKVKITKQSSTGQFLQGAAFEVYASNSNDFASATTTGLAGTTAADGTATIGSIRYSDHARGDGISDASPVYQYYWLVETAAPAGHELLPDAIPFQLTDANSSGFTVGVSVENVPVNGGFTLPLTGGTFATFLFSVVGALLVAGAILLLVHSRRRLG